MLGVSRTITLDTTGGKLYGGLQYGKSGESLLQEGEVILTFDDGPLRRHTRRVLKALDDHCTKGTFFMVGRMAVADPAMVREVEAAGHTIATHTWSHLDLAKRGSRRAGGEIELGISAIQQAATKPISTFFRFPYLAHSKSMISYLKARDLGVFSIDIDSADFRTRRPERVYGKVMRELRQRRKGILLFHDIQPSTASAMKRLLDDMHRSNFKVVHIVSKQPVTTETEYDEKAAALHAKKRTIASAPALTKWIGGPEQAERKSARTKTQQTHRRNPFRSTPSRSRRKSYARTIRHPVERKLRSSNGSSWRQQVFGN